MRKMLLLALLALNTQAEETTYYGCEKKEGSPTIAIVHIKEKFINFREKPCPLGQGGIARCR